VPDRGGGLNVKRGARGNPSGLRAGDPNRWLAALLSLLWPGLGQMYGGRWGKGLLMFFGQAANLVLLFATVGLLSVPALWLWGIIDAYAGAARAPAAASRRPAASGGSQTAARRA